MEKENYEWHKSKELLTYEVNNLKKELSYKKKVVPIKIRKSRKWFGVIQSQVRVNRQIWVRIKIIKVTI